MGGKYIYLISPFGKTLMTVEPPYAKYPASKLSGFGGLYWCLQLAELLSPQYFVPLVNGPIDGSHKQCTDGHEGYGLPRTLMCKVKDRTTVRSEYIEAWLIHGLGVYRIIFSRLKGDKRGSKNLKDTNPSRSTTSPTMTSAGLWNRW